MSTTIPAATPNPNITVRNLQSDIRDSSTFSSIHEVDIGDQQAMNECIQMRVTEATNEAIREYQALSMFPWAVPATAEVQSRLLKVLHTHVSLRS